MSHSDSSFYKTLIIVIAILTAFMLMSITIARVLTSKSPEAIANDPMYQSAVLERIKPVGHVKTGSSNAGAGAQAMSGVKVYNTACLACHDTGIAGAPKFADKSAWKTRIAQGMSTLVSHAIKGFNGMPAKGGRSDLSDAAVEAAVKHMVDGSK